MDHIEAQFTEDTIATQPSICQRPRCEAPTINVGERRHYIANVTGSVGRFVCGNCYDYYKRQPSTAISVYPIYFYRIICITIKILLGTAQPTLQRSGPGVSDAQLRNQAVNVQGIRQGVNM